MKIAVFGEIYSQNVGDGVIYDSLEYLFGLKRVELVPCDLSGRQGWLGEDREPIEKPVSKFRKMMRSILSTSRFLQRTYSALHWFAFRRKKVLGRWKNAIASSDAVLIGGGQLLTDISFGFPPRIFEVARIAKAYRKPLVFFGCGVGSNGWGYVAQKMYGYALSYAKYVSCRDFPSSEVIRSYFPNLTVHVHPDPAFVFGQAYLGCKESLISDTPVIGFNFQNSDHFRRFVSDLKQLSDTEYVEFWVSVIRASEKEGFRPIIFSNGDPSDYRFSELVFGRLVNLGSQAELLRRPTRSDYLYEDICSMDYVVSTRMHAGIVAHSLKRPIATLAWDKKVESVWATVRKSEVVVSSSIFYSNDPWAIIKESLLTQFPSEVELMEIFENILTNVDFCIQKLSR